LIKEIIEFINKFRCPNEKKLRESMFNKHYDDLKEKIVLNDDEKERK